MVSLEEENFLRIVYLYYKVVTPTLKRFFDGKHSNLSADLSANKTKLLQLYNRPPGQTRVLYKQQIDTLYPPSGSTPVASADLDLTLMVCLLRHLPPVVPTPWTGFDKLPLKRDTTYGANIARIKYYKNYLVSHSTSGKIVVNVFNDIWTELEMAIKGLGSAQDVADATIAKTKILDSSMAILLSTQDQLEIKIAKLEKRMEREEITRTDITTRIKTFEKQTLTFEKSTKQLIEESKNKTSETLKETQDKSHSECTRIDTNIKVIEKEIAELKKLLVVSSKELKRLEILVIESKTKADDMKKQIESKCSEIQKQLSVHDERISTLEEVKLQEDVKYSEFKLDIEELRTEVAQIKTDQKYVPDWMITKLQQWKKDEDYFVETRASNHVMRCLLHNECVSVVGPPGVGKSCLVQHVALEMEKIGFNVMIVNTPNEIKKNYQLSSKLLFVVDDMCGQFTTNTTRLEKWKKGMKDISDILDTYWCKLIITCRLQVFQDEGFNLSDLKMFQKCVCNLIDYRLALTKYEKHKLATKYFMKTYRNELECLYKYAFFPLLCKLYDKNKGNYNFSLQGFLKDPFNMYKKELDDLFVDSNEGKYKFCALLLVVICNNELEKKVLEDVDDNMKKILKIILEKCGITERLKGPSFISELDTLKESFLVIENGIYHTIHDKLFDVLACYFGTSNKVTNREFTRLLIKHAKGNFVGERFVFIEPGKSEDTIRDEYLITILDDIISLYIERVFCDLTKSNSTENCLNGNRNKHNKSFRENLSHFINQLHKDKISFLIKNASSDFVCSMFVMNKSDIKSFYETTQYPLYQSDYYGIILGHDHLQKYIERMFDDMIKYEYVVSYMSKSRCCRNDVFHTTLMTYLSKLSSDRIKELIQVASTAFVQDMFVMKAEDIHESSKSIYQRYGIEVSGDLIQFYIERVLKEMTSRNNVPDYIASCRCSGNKEFDTALQNCMGQLSSTRIKEIIKNASYSFVEKMFVMRAEDIKQRSREGYRTYGIRLTDDVMQVYIERVFYDMTKSDDVTRQINCNRNSQNTEFYTKLLDYMTQINKTTIEDLIKKASRSFIYQLCIMTMDDMHEIGYNECERYGVIVPDECIQLYVERWFDEMTKSRDISKFFEGNRNKLTNKFKTALLTYIEELDDEQIENLIKTASEDCVVKMFVTTRTDIKTDSIKDFEHYGIVLQDKYLDMYTERVLCLQDFIDNIKFTNRTVKILLKFMSQLDESRITDLIKTANKFLVHQMITVDVEKQLILDKTYQELQISDSTVKNVLEMTEGLIMCPVSLVDVYMNRMISDWGKGNTYDVFTNRNLKNQSFVEKFLDHLNLLEPSKITELVNIKDNRWEYTPLRISCKEGEVNLAKWNLENHLHDIPEQKHNILFALFLLVVFNNQLEEIIVNDELIKNTDKKFSFRMSLDIQEGISSRVVKEELNTSLQILGVGQTEGIYSVKYNEVFHFLVFYFASIRQMSKVLVKYVDEKFLCEWFLVEQSLVQHKYFIIPLSDEEMRTCINRVLTKLTNCGKFIKYILEGYTTKYVNSVTAYINELNKEKIATILKTSSIDFINQFFVIKTKETKYYSDEESIFSIELPDDLTPIYLKRILDNLSNNPCVEACLKDNTNKQNEIFRTKLLMYMKDLNIDDVKMLIEEASSDFIGRMLILSKDDIKPQSCWEYERYGIVVPGNLLHIYIERVFIDMKKSVYAPVNRNSENKTFRDTLHSYIENSLKSLLDTANSKFICRMFLSTEGELAELQAHRYENYRMCIPKQYFRTGSDTQSLGLYPSFTEDDPLTCTIITNKDRNSDIATITVRSKMSIDNLQHILSKYIDPMFTSKIMEMCITEPEPLVEKYIQRMVADWIRGNVDDVVGNINLSIKSFRSNFFTHLKNIEKSTQTQLIETTDNLTGDSALAVSCRVGIIELVEWCLDNKANTNSCNKYNESPLYIACCQNRPDIVYRLLQSNDKADVNSKSGKLKILPLYEACKSGNDIIVSMLLKENADVNDHSTVTCVNETPLYLACKYGNSQIVSLLLDRKANPIDITIDNNTPLFIACERGHTEIVSLLLELKETRIYINKGDITDKTPLYIACKRGHTIIVSLLLDRMTNHIRINKGDRNNKTPLYIACKRGHTDIVSLLLKHDADEVDMYRFTYKQETPLYAACQGGYKDIVLLLLARGTKVINKSRMDGASPLWIACREGHVAIVSTLLNQIVIEIDKCILIGMSPLFIASLLGHTEIVQILLDKKADASICVKKKKIVMQVSEKLRTEYRNALNTQEYIGYIRKLVRENASKHLQSYIDDMAEGWVFDLMVGSSPLHVSSLMGHTEIVKLLVESNSNIDSLSDNGSTPLFLACELGHEDIVQVLVVKGADPTLVRKDGKSPLTIARDNKHTEIVGIIKSQTDKPSNN